MQAIVAGAQRNTDVNGKAGIQPAHGIISDGKASHLGQAASRSGPQRAELQTSPFESKSFCTFARELESKRTSCIGKNPSPKHLGEAGMSGWGGEEGLGE